MMGRQTAELGNVALSRYFLKEGNFNAPGVPFIIIILPPNL